MKYLVLFILVIGVLWYFFRPREKKKDASLMIECAMCGVYVPNDEALRFKGKCYCSKECLDSIKERG